MSHNQGNVDIMSDNTDITWFSVERKRENLFLITEPFYFAENRCNIWLLRGGHTDLVIDCGLGVHNLRAFLEERQLVDPVDKLGARPVVTICTHVHFDHSGGARDFEKVLIHETEADALRKGNTKHTLNWVKSDHFSKNPSRDFVASRYRVQQTACVSVRDCEQVEIGADGETVEVMHLPGHSPGSIALFYARGAALFVGDIVYECGYGTGLLDWLPTSSVDDYIRSCQRLRDFLETADVSDVYPGHFAVLSPGRAQELLTQYVTYKQNILSRGFAGCLRMLSTIYFKLR